MLKGIIENFFDIHSGNNGLTEEAIYLNPPQTVNDAVKVFSSALEKNTQMGVISATAKLYSSIGVAKSLKKYSGNGIIIARNGNAGRLTLVNNKLYTMNDHAYLLQVKKNYEKKILLEYIYYTEYSNIKKFISADGDGNNSTFNKTSYEKSNIEIPDVETQLNIINNFSKIENLRDRINNYLSPLGKTLDKPVMQVYKKYQAQGESIKNILDYLSGNSGLTEEFIYQNLQNNEEKYKVLSSTILDNYLGYISKVKIKGKLLKTLENKAAILINRKGKAGYTQFLDSGKYTINDNVYLLFIKKNCKYEINLNWLMLVYRKDFFEYSSNCDNGTWNMTGFFENVKINIPSIEEQNIIAQKWQELLSLKNKLSNIQIYVQELMNKELIF